MTELSRGDIGAEIDDRIRRALLVAFFETLLLATVFGHLGGSSRSSFWLAIERTLVLALPARGSTSSADRRKRCRPRNRIAILLRALLPRLMQYLEEQAPKVHVDARPLGSAFDEELVAGELDIVVGPRREASAGIVWSPLLRDRFVTVCRRGHPRIAETLGLEGFLAERHVLAIPDGGPRIGDVDRALEPDGLNRTVVVRVPTFYAATQLVMSSDMLATLPWGIVSPLPSGALRVFDPPVLLSPIALHAGWHERLRHDPTHAWFRGVLAKVARELEDA